MSPILGILASSKPPAVPNSYESIATVTVGGGGSATITFSSIPSTYTHLQIRAIGKNTNASGAGTNLNLIFNSDSGANYSYHSIYGDGSSATATSGTSTSLMWIGHTTTSASSSPTATNIFAPLVTDILDYANTNKYKTIRTLNGNDTNSTAGYLFFNSGSWRSTAAVTSMTLSNATANFAEYSSFALYGIKG